MNIAVFNKYKNGMNTLHEISLPNHVTVTGKEDHFALAYNDAKNILAGMRYVEPDVNWSIKSITLG